ncbi:alpha/beta fold hydrolase [Georgenia ruanii]|uniref:Alpha/beta fold hydrolase n=1 Tax=Georgenia ruanii TaxID=348442 RepID=A0A7J9UZN6_9MICO|nr:alpha/beta fold hydrolase [Georgenia ruanii]MPV89154.1 alpha/beta fold hydrolase [Georgenia ruanii]
MTRFLLVHGAFSGAWCWESTAAELRARGHRADAIDLPGSGDDRTPVGAVTLDAYATRVGEALAADPEPAVLVGHSMGGAVITHTAGRCPERIASLIYVAAFLPTDGMSLVAMTQLPEGAGDGVQDTMVVSGEPPVATMSDEDSREVFLGECDEAEVAWALPRFRPQPLQPFLDPVRLPGGALTRPRDYVLATKDHAIPPALQRRMAREGGVERVVELDADHSPFFSRRGELVEALDMLAAGRAG